MSININKDKCIGCGRCTEICPNTFKLSNEGKSEVINKNDLNCAMKASDQCPVEAIMVNE
ncbi:ferredoxin [bacterium]|nr:ferredoxin [bacterium]